MAAEVRNLSDDPYSSVALVVAYFPDGSRATGTGALVGRNDILTATHVIYSPESGGWAIDLRIYPGVDYNGSTRRHESEPLIDLDGVNWRLMGYPSQVFHDDNHDSLSLREIQNDVALIGIDRPIGDELGWFELAGGYNGMQAACQIGYPITGTGMMAGETTVVSEASYSVYKTDVMWGGEVMGPGSSGGPLYVMDEFGRPTVIGVKSGATSTAAYWADIGRTLEQLQDTIAANDDMIAGTIRAAAAGTAGDDVFFATLGAERVNGGSGLDRIHYAGIRSEFAVHREGTLIRVDNKAAAHDKDELSGIERLIFDDGTLAFDVGRGEIAGQIYRLYQGAFDRVPDTGGLGYWISQMDGGLTIDTVAQGFMGSAEFRAAYGSAFDPAGFIERLYSNVLDRAPDTGGYAYWNGILASGEAPANLLVHFSESAENVANTSAAIADGLWLV